MNKKTNFIIVGIVFILLIFGVMYSDDEKNINTDEENNINNDVIENIEKLENIYEKNEHINKFLNEYNATNPSLKITKDMVSARNNSIIYIHNTDFRGFQILSKTDNGKEMISVQIEKHTNDSLDFKNLFDSLMKVYIPKISNERLDELFKILINGNYSIDYINNEEALKYENVYLSFSDSGSVSVYGRDHFCFIRLYGEY